MSFNKQKIASISAMGIGLTAIATAAFAAAKTGISAETVLGLTTGSSAFGAGYLFLCAGQSNHGNKDEAMATQSQPESPTDPS